MKKNTKDTLYTGFEQNAVTNLEKTFALFVAALHFLFGEAFAADKTIDANIWKADEKNIRAAQNRLTKFKTVSSDGKKAVTKSNPISAANLKFIMPVLRAGILSKELFAELKKRFEGKPSKLYAACDALREQFSNVRLIGKTLDLSKEQKSAAIKAVQDTFIAGKLPIFAYRTIFANFLDVPTAKIQETKIADLLLRLAEHDSAERKIIADLKDGETHAYEVFAKGHVAKALVKVATATPKAPTTPKVKDVQPPATV